MRGHVVRRPIRKIEKTSFLSLKREGTLINCLHGSNISSYVTPSMAMLKLSKVHVRDMFVSFHGYVDIIEGRRSRYVSFLPWICRHYRRYTSAICLFPSMAMSTSSKVHVRDMFVSFHGYVDIIEGTRSRYVFFLS